MTKFKKLAAILLSAVMLVCCFALQAGAESVFDTAKAINSGKKYTKELKRNECADYKITANKSGKLVLKLIADIYRVEINVCDSDGAKLDPEEYKSASGYSWNNQMEWDSSTEIASATYTYDIKKGTYYIRIISISSINKKGKLNVTATFPSSETDSSSKISCITIPMKVGGTMQLSTDGGDKGITWSSSKSSVATVSSAGKVTAKKAGTTVITAKSGSGTAKIQIKVTK